MIINVISWPVRSHKLSNTDRL